MSKMLKLDLYTGTSSSSSAYPSPRCTSNYASFPDETRAREQQRLLRGAEVVDANTPAPVADDPAGGSAAVAFLHDLHDYMKATLVRIKTTPLKVTSSFFSKSKCSSRANRTRRKRKRPKEPPGQKYPCTPMAISASRLPTASSFFHRDRRKRNKHDKNSIPGFSSAQEIRKTKTAAALALLLSLFFSNLYQILHFVQAKIPDVAVDQLRSSLPNGNYMVNMFEQCDKVLLSTPGRPDGCQIDTYSAEYAFEVFNLKRLFETEKTFLLTTCDGYRRVQSNMMLAETSCKTASTPNLDYWPLECMILQAELDRLYLNKTLEQNIVCNMLTQGRRDAMAVEDASRINVVNCNQLAHSMITKYHPFLYRPRVEGIDHLFPQKCRERLCTTQKFFYSRIRPRAVQNYTLNASANLVYTTTPVPVVVVNTSNGSNGTTLLLRELLGESERTKGYSSSSLVEQYSLQLSENVEQTFWKARKSLNNQDYNGQLEELLHGGNNNKPAGNSGSGLHPANSDDVFLTTNTQMSKESWKPRGEQTSEASRRLVAHRAVDAKSSSPIRGDKESRHAAKTSKPKEARSYNHDRPPLQDHALVKNINENFLLDFDGEVKFGTPAGDSKNYPHEDKHFEEDFQRYDSPVHFEFYSALIETHRELRSLGERRDKDEENKFLRNNKAEGHTISSKWAPKLEEKTTKRLLEEAEEKVESEKLERNNRRNQLFEKFTPILHLKLRSRTRTKTRRLKKESGSRISGSSKQAQAVAGKNIKNLEQYVNSLTMVFDPISEQQKQLQAEAGGSASVKRRLDNENELYRSDTTEAAGGHQNERAIVPTRTAGTTSHDPLQAAQAIPPPGLLQLRALDQHIGTTPAYTLWPENFYLDGCEKISYMPFDEFQCAEYLENRAFCECVIPQLQNVDLQLDGNCYAEYERYFLFGRRGLAEAVLSDVCANSLRSFIVQIRDFPQCSVADLPNDQEMPYTPFAIEMAATKGIEDANVVGNIQYNQMLELAKQLRTERPSCPWLQDSGESLIMECMDRFRCHVQYDGWGCCIKSYRFAIAQPWHYVEAYHSDPNLCCVHNETVNAQGEIVTIFERPIPSTRPVGNRRCPPEAPQMCNELSSGGAGDFICRAECPKKRSCSPILFPEPLLMTATNDTKPYPLMEYQGNGCCVYDDMYEIAISTTSKVACLFLCDIDPDCLGATVSAGNNANPCRHHLLDPLRRKKLTGFRLGCQPSLSAASLERSDQDCWLKKIILTESPTEDREETDVILYLMIALGIVVGVAAAAGLAVVVRFGLLELERRKREKRKRKVDPTKYEMEFAAEGDDRKILENLKQPKTEEEKLMALAKIGKVVRAGQKLDFAKDFDRIEKKATIDAPKLEKKIDPLLDDDDDAISDMQIGEVQAADAKNWREQDDFRKMRRLKKRARKAGLKLDRYLSLRQLQASKGLRDPRTIRSLTMQENGEFTMNDADRPWKESNDGARYMATDRNKMIKVGDDEHGDFDLSKMGVDTSKLVGTGRISFLEDTETVPAYALEGGQGQDSLTQLDADSTMDLQKKLQQPGASVTAEERARQLLSGDVTAGDFVDLEDSMMDDSFIEERKKVMIDKFAPVSDKKGELLMRQIQPKKGPAKETIPQSPKREKKFPAGTDLTTQPTEFNPMSLEATDPKRSMASFSVEPKSPQSQRIKYKEEFEKEAAEEDYYDPIEKYPSLIISVDLFKGHGGSLGLKFEDTDVNPNSTRVIGFHDPVQKRWGWRIGDEIVAILQSRRAGDKAWFPIENFDQLYKRFTTIKETWQEFQENKRIYFGVYRPNIPKGEKYPPLPMKLHMITARYLDDRGSDFDDSSEDEYWQLTDDINVKKKRKTLPRADWLRYCAWKFNIEKENQAVVEYQRRMQKRLDIEAGEGKFFQDPANLADFQEVVNVLDEYGRSTYHTIPRGIDVHLEKQRKIDKEKNAEKQKKLKQRVKNKDQILPSNESADFRTWPNPEAGKDITLKYDWPGETTGYLMVSEGYDVGTHPIGMYDDFHAGSP